MTSSIAFGGFPLTGTSPGGGALTVQSLDGWLSRALRRERQDRAQQSGAWPSTGQDSALPITVRGQAVYSTDVAAAAERRTILALGGQGVSDFTVTDPAGIGTRQVELDALIVSPVRDAMFTYSLVVTACDPVMYGPLTFASTSLSGTAGGTGLVYPLAYPLNYGVAPGVTPGALTLLNGGTTSYWPRLRIDGPVPNPRVTLVETGDTIRYGATLAAGQWLDIDCANRRVLLNGQVSVRHLVSSSGSWLAIPTGGGSITWTADAADPNAELSVWGYEGAWT